MLMPRSPKDDFSKWADAVSISIGQHLEGAKVASNLAWRI